MTEATLQNDVPTMSGLVIYHAGKIRAATANKDSAVGALRSQKAQAETSGLDLDALDSAMKITSSKKNDADKLQAIKSLARTAEYAEFLSPELFKQISFEDYLAERGSPKSDDGLIFEEGRHAALTGSATQPPAGYNATQSEHWGEGWREGEAERNRFEEMAANYTAAQEAEASDEIEDEDLDDDDMDEAEEEPEPVAEVSPEPATSVIDFAKKTEEKAAEEMPDIPPALDRRKKANDQPSAVGSGFDVSDAG